VDNSPLAYFQGGTVRHYDADCVLAIDHFTLAMDLQGIKLWNKKRSFMIGLSTLITGELSIRISLMCSSL